MPIIRRTKVIAVVYFILLQSIRAVAAEAPEEGSSQVRLIVAAGTSIPGLVVSYENLELIRGKDSKDRSIFYVQLKGTLSQPYTDLLVNTQRILRTEERVPVSFSSNVAVIGKKTLIKIRTIGLRGEVSEVQGYLWMPDFEARKKFLLRGLLSKSVAVGYTSVHYVEQGNVDVSTGGISVKGSFSYQLIPDRWDMAISAYVTGFQLYSNETAEARFLGLNLRTGYSLPFIGPPWTVSIMGGFYYTTMFVTRNAFGFQNMAGPQLFPVIKYQISDKSSISTYFKYSPILGEAGLLPFTSRELAFGALYSRLLGENTVMIGADFADLRLLVGSVAVSSVSLSVNLGFGW